jgi:iron(III) transport system substrate-binding protein
MGLMLRGVSKKLVTVVVGLLLIGTIAGTCGADDASERLVVYSGRSESLVGPLFAQFEAGTGIEVAVKYGSTSEMAATLLEEGENSPADIYFAQDPGGLGIVDKATLLTKLSNKILRQVPEWAKSPEGRWVGISGRARVVVYNTDRLSEDDLPESVEGFVSQEWKGRVGWAPTNGSFQAMVTGMRVMWGDERTTNWLTGMKANDPKEYPKNTPIVAAAASGEIDVGLVNHYYLYRFIQEQGEGFAARNYHPTSLGPDSLVMVAGAGILKTSKNPTAAEKFIDFMLSPEAQQYFTDDTFEYPVVEGVATHSLLKPMDEIQKPTIDMADLDDLQGTQALLRDLGILN